MTRNFARYAALLASLGLLTSAVTMPSPAARAQEGAPAAGAAKQKEDKEKEKTVPVATKAGLSFEIPQSWKSSPPTSAMRQAEVTLPKVEGDPEDAELVVFHFGASDGGTVQANLDRWCGQFEGPGGTPAKDSAKITKREVSGLPVTVLDVSGTYVAPVRIGAPERFHKPSFRMIAAVVQTKGGSFFLKLVGPEKTLAANAKKFDAVIESVKFGAGG